MKHAFLSLSLLALVLFLPSCKEEDNPASPGTNNTPGTIRITRGVLVTMGLNGIGLHDTIAFRIGRGTGYSGNISLTSFDWEILANHTGFLKPEDDIWSLSSTGSGSGIYRIERPGNAPYFGWDFNSAYGSEYYSIRTAKTTSDTTSFRINALSNGHFTIELVFLPGYYLNAQLPQTPGRTTEFVQGKPQEFWFEPWE